MGGVGSRFLSVPTLASFAPTTKDLVTPCTSPIRSVRFADVMASYSRNGTEQTAFVEQQVKASPSSSTQQPFLTDLELEEANTALASAEPQEILLWAIQRVPRLFQTTAFGLTGLAATDMISKISTRLSAPEEPPKHLVPLIFLDTLYHFPETLELADQVSRKYGADLHTYAPQGASSRQQFEALNGTELWVQDEEAYDFLVKAEPAQRAYAELNVNAVLTGRRRSQGADRASIRIIEKDPQGLIKINPLANWSFKEVKAYIDANKVPYNVLLDQGYTSVGDWHSTVKADGGKADNISVDAAERAGRWAGRKEKTECGLHKDYFKMKMAMQKKQREQQLANKDAARDDGAKSGDAPQLQVGSNAGVSVETHQFL